MKNRNNLGMLPSVHYVDTQSNMPFICYGVATTLADNSTSSQVMDCSHCGFKMKKHEMRQHMAYHILKHFGIKNYQCGFCGSADSAQCVPTIVKGSRGGKAAAELVKSSCKAWFNFYIGAAKSNYCTNYPMKCTACSNLDGATPTYLWKYSMEKHYEAIHPDVPCPRDSTVSEEEKNSVLSKWRLRMATLMNK